MKQIQKKFFNTYNWLIAIALGLLGFSSACLPVCEYGSPSAKYIVKGTIVSAENQQPLKDIQVVVPFDTVKSDANGNYQVAVIEFPIDSMSIELKFEDVNSTDGINYQPLDTTVIFLNSDFEDGDGNWYSGEATKTFNVKLKK